MKRIMLSELSCRKGRDHYTVALRPQHGERVSFQTDGNLGQIMSGLSTLFEAIRVMRYGGTMKQPMILRGSITLTTFRIEPQGMWPYRRWVLTMIDEAGHVYQAEMESDLELVLLAFQGAMKFFGFKHGLTTFDAEVVRNRDQAGELGLLTKEDFHA